MNYTDAQKEKMYRDFHGKVFGYLISRINDRETAEDLAADVFVKAFGTLDRFDESRASLSTWIYTITRNTLIDYYRTRSVSDEIPETLDDGTNVEETVCNSEMLEVLAAALETLDERERKIIVLRYYSGKTLKEIAGRLGISYAYVKVLQNRALDKIKKYL